MTENLRRSWYLAAGILAVSLILGGWLRLSGLEARSITHPEMYVPGIRLPEGISEPAERLTVRRVLTGTFSSDTHPPGYYLLMLSWTRLMGTSLRMMRLPSALFGIGCIALIFRLGALAGRPVSGAVAAALLAFSGYHVFWSQVARMFALDCFLGLAATVLLLSIARGAKPHALLIAGYVALILAGVGTHVFFWSLFATHMIWAFGNAWGRRQLPDLCRAQLFALVLGSPLIAFAAYQSANTVAELSGNALLYLAEFLPFAFLLPTSDSGFFPSAVPFTGTAGFWAIRAAFLLLAAFLLAVGLHHLWRSPQGAAAFPEPASRHRLWILAWIAAGLAGTLQIAGFLYMSRSLPPEYINGSIAATRFLFILPLTLAAGAILLEGRWSALPPPTARNRYLNGDNALIALLAFGPLVLLVALAQLRPILNHRGLLFAAPYLLLLLAIGLVELRRSWRLLVAPLVAVGCVASLSSYSGMTVDPADYARFAAAVKADLRATDLVFIRKAWYETPILYYLHADQCRLVGRDYALACARNPDARVWVVLLYDSDPTDEMTRALPGYQSVRTVTAPHAKAILYQRSLNRNEGQEPAGAAAVVAVSRQVSQ
jgi:hypothetical protein